MLRQEEREAEVKEVVSRLLYLVPGMQALLLKLGFKKVDYACPRLRASALSHIAFGPSLKGRVSARNAQTIVVSAIANCVLAQQ